MADPLDDQPCEELLSTLCLHDDEQGQRLARSATMWLSVARRPLYACELWIAIRIGESLVAGHLERLLAEPDPVDDAQAAPLVARLLGDLVQLHRDDEGNVHVTLHDSEPYSSLSPADIRCRSTELAFSDRQAHAAVGRICMAICSVSTLHLANVHDRNAVSSLILYAWGHWHTHLDFSEIQPSTEDGDNSRPFASMVPSVCMDVLRLLVALSDSVTSVMILPSVGNHLECVAAVKRAQRSLETPLMLLSALAGQRDCSVAPQRARDTFEGPQHIIQSSDVPADGLTKRQGARSLDHSAESTSPSPSTAQSRYTNLESQAGLSPTERLLDSEYTMSGETDRMAMFSFAETAKWLQAVHIAFDEPVLRAIIITRLGKSWSPSIALAMVAHWMEAVARRLYRYESPDNSHQSRKTLDSINEFKEFAPPTNNRMIRASPSSRETEMHHTASPQAVARGTTQHPRDTPTIRWQAVNVLANLLYYIMRLSGVFKSKSAVIINDFQGGSSPPVTVPPQLYGSGNPTHRLSPLVPNYIRSCCMKSIAPLVDLLDTSGLLKSLEEGGSCNQLSRARAVVLAAGYHPALRCCIVAILLNHVRRTLFPWLAAYQYDSPIQDIRLAYSHPDVFLDEAFSLSWGWIVFMLAQKYVCDIVATLTATICVIGDDPVPQTRVASSSRPQNIINPKTRDLTGVARVVYILWILTNVEYAIDRSASTVAFFAAYRKLAFGVDAEHIALGRILETHWPKLLLSIYQLSYYTARGILPMLWGSVESALRGQPRLLLAVLAICGGTAQLLRYRSQLIVALELSGLFIVIGFATLSLVLVASEFICDPLGLQSSTEKARRVAALAREALPVESHVRIEVPNQRADHASTLQRGSLRHPAKN